MDMKAPVRVLFACGAAFVFSLVASLFLDVTHLSSPHASALTTVPTKMNFQGRLTDSSGVIVANGTYNMQFRLYSASSGGSLLWSEERLVNDTKGVTVTNGLFAIKLGEGDVIGASTGSTPLNPANFASGSVYLEVTMATPANATTNTASTSMVWESPMSPRSLMASSAYAFNSETLDGLDSADFAQITAANTFTNTNLFKTNSANAFEVQNNSSVSLLKADTSGMSVTINGSIDQTGTTLTQVGSLAANANTAYIREFDISGNYMYVINQGTNGPMTIVDISNPTSPTVVGSVSNSSMTTARDIRVSGHYAYVASFNDTFTVIDVSNPSSPTVVGTLTDATYLDQAHGLDLQGRYAYVTATNGVSANGYLTIIDISNPTAPTRVASVNDSNLRDAKQVDVQDKYAYVTSGATATPGGLVIVDISNPAAPTVTGSVMSNTYMDGARDVVYAGKYVYVVGSSDDSFVAINVTNPAAPTIAGTVTNSTYMDEPYDISINGKYAYVASNTSGTIAVIDISNPASPSLQTSLTYTFSGVTPTASQMSGRYLFVNNNTFGAGTSNIRVLDTGGTKLGATSTSTLQTNDIQVSTNADIGGDLIVGDTLRVGLGGIESDGSLSILGKGLIATADSKAFEVQSSSGASMLNVDTLGAGTVTLLGSSSSVLGTWQTASNNIPNMWPSSTTATGNGYVYVSGGDNLGTIQSTVYYARLQPDGNLGAWQTAANTLPQPVYNASSAVVNGYLYVLGGRASGGAFTALAYYSKLGADGTPGTWSSMALGNFAQTGIAVKGSYIYLIAGDDNPSGLQNLVVAYRSNADGSLTSLGAAGTTNAYANESGVAVGNYVYAIGGYDGSVNRTEVYYAQPAADGSISSWSSTTAIPGAASGTIAAVVNGTIYVRSGTSVYYARPATNGTITSWSTLTGAPSVSTTIAANGYLYSIASTSQYAKAGASVSVGGGIDLVTLQSQAGTAGGYIMAGDISSTGSLQVQGAANFGAAVSVAGDINAGNGIFSTASGNSIVRVGSATADATGVVLVLDTKNTSADPTGAAATNGAMYYNSALARFRCYEGSAWTNCTPSTRVAVSTATQAPAAGTDTIVNGSTVPLGTAGLIGPTGSNQNGTLITWRIKMSKTAAGTGATTFTIRFGTAGTTADTARCTAFSTGTATAVVDVADVVITAYATAGGSTATLNCAGTMSHMLATTGFNNAAYFVQAYSTQTSFNSTPAGTKASLSITAGTGSTITIQKVETQAVNL